MGPVISVVLPIYKPNLIQLDEALKSIATQTFENYECLCICDSPDEATTTLLAKFTKKDPRFRIILGHDAGLIDALNLGLSVSSGQYIARMDVDDISLKDRFQLQYNLLENNDYDIVGGHYFIINNESKYISARVVPVGDYEIRLTLASTVPFAHSSVMIRSSYLKKEKLGYGLGKNLVAEDYQLWVQMMNRGARFGNVDEWLLAYRWSDDSLSQRVKSSNKRDTLKIREEYFLTNIDKLNEAIAYMAGTQVSDELEETMVFVACKLALKKLSLKPIFTVSKISRRFLAQGILKFFFEKI
ncbi:glycosyltransferase [Polynucleobacter sp. 86C-FISCH]|uniref:glycosyltransferase n=1 Tax=Polynucleobacter sp. 86C-FISCH TaxID=2689101 RepID=UPI001C0BD88F|nr:glycosyltransferase [Polynucleobacter sp. 86C-FISCH]MBU3596012.1 glycosyltransferase [Polynucleobacter sp. 86C-FISCH]